MAANHFMVVIRDPIKDRIKLPHPFTMTHGPKLTNPVTLRRRDKHEGVVQIEKTNGEIWLTMGWKGFARANDIKSNYVVLFDYGGLSSDFEVAIYHVSAVELPHPNYPLGTILAEFFKFISKSARLHKLELPKKFNILFADKLDNPLSLFPGDGTMWKVYWKVVDGQIILCKGWKDAATHMSLRVGDFCFFTYSDNSVISVIACKESKGQITFSSRRRDVNDDEVEMVQHTLWTTVVTEYMISKSKPLYIPAAVVKTQFRNKPEEITVKIPSGDFQNWALIWNTTRSGNEAYLGRGWYEFVVDYPLALNQTERFFKEGNGAYIHVEVK